jgi:hypothetical protein
MRHCWRSRLCFHYGLCVQVAEGKVGLAAVVEPPGAQLITCILFRYRQIFRRLVLLAKELMLSGSPDELGPWRAPSREP